MAKRKLIGTAKFVKQTIIPSDVADAFTPEVMAHIDAEVIDYEKRSARANRDFIFQLHSYCMKNADKKMRAKKRLHALIYDEIAALIDRHWKETL